MSTSAAVWSTQFSNETSGVASALVSVMTALLALRGADGVAQDRASVLEKIALLDQTASWLERRVDEDDQIDVSSCPQNPRAELCAARQSLVSGLASTDALVSAMTDLHRLVDARPDVLPTEIALRLLSATSLVTGAVERSIAFRRRAIAGIEHEIDSQDVELLLAKPSQPVPWDEARKAFGLS